DSSSESEESQEDSNGSSHKPRPSTLQCHELGHLEEVQNAMLIFPDETQYRITGSATNMMEAVNLPCVYIRKIIKFCKQIEAFKGLPQNDQLCLLKSFFPNVNSVRFSYLYRPDLDGIPMIKVGELRNKLWPNFLNFV